MIHSRQVNLPGTQGWVTSVSRVFSRWGADIVCMHPVSFSSLPTAFCLLPSSFLPQSSGIRQSSKSQNQEEDTSEHGIQSLTAGALPFTCSKPPDVRGDDDGGHEKRPSEDGAHISQARGDIAVDDRAAKPHRAHNGSEHPVAAGAWSLIKTCGVVLLPEIDAIEDVGNERGGVERRPDDVGLAAWGDSLHAGDFLQLVSKRQSKVDQR